MTNLSSLSVKVIIYDQLGQVLLLQRSQASKNNAGKWDLPGGKLDPGENFNEALLREVQEETGIEAEIIEPLGTISYEFNAGNILIAKTVHHFLLRQTGGSLSLENDPNHEAIDVKWVSIDELSAILTHENERRMARGVLEWVERN